MGEKLSEVYASPLASNPKLECVVETVLQGDNTIYRVYEKNGVCLSQLQRGEYEVHGDNNRRSFIEIKARSVTVRTRELEVGPATGIPTKSSTFHL